MKMVPQNRRNVFLIMYLFQRSYNCTKSWIVVASISFMRSIILIASLFVSMLGVGIHGQSWYNWLFFVGVAHWCGLIHAFTKSLTFDVHSFCMALIWMEMLAFCLVLMWKRRSIERLVLLLDEQMPRKVVTLFALLPIVERAVIRHTGHTYCYIQGVLWLSPVRSALKSTLLDIVSEIYCILESIAFVALEVACSFYLVIFLGVYFVKNKYLDQVSEYKAIRFKDEVAFISLRTFDLHEQPEDGLSFVLFFKVTYDFAGIIIYVRLNVGLPQFSNRILFAHQIYSLCRTLFYTVSLFTFVACLQERVENRCDRIHRILCRLFASQVLEVESSTASSSASSRAESPFARCSKCPTLACSPVE